MSVGVDQYKNVIFCLCRTVRYTAILLAFGDRVVEFTEQVR